MERDRRHSNEAGVNRRDADIDRRAMHHRNRVGIDPFDRSNRTAVSFHSLRHTAASWLFMQGVDLYVVGQLLGHKTPHMTRRYAHLSPHYLAGAVGKLDGVFADVMPEKALCEAALVPVESPALFRTSARSR
jgi:site-specific recombinase XerD